MARWRSARHRNGRTPGCGEGLPARVVEESKCTIWGILPRRARCGVPERSLEKRMTLQCTHFGRADAECVRQADTEAPRPSPWRMSTVRHAVLAPRCIAPELHRRRRIDRCSFPWPHNSPFLARVASRSFCSKTKDTAVAIGDNWMDPQQSWSPKSFPCRRPFRSPTRISRSPKSPAAITPRAVGAKARSRKPSTGSAQPTTSPARGPRDGPARVRQAGRPRRAARIWAFCHTCDRSTELKTHQLVAVYGAEFAIADLKRRLTCRKCGERPREIRIVYAVLTPLEFASASWGPERATKLGFALVPGSADFIRPSVIPAPAINGAIERSALARRLGGDTRQPFTVRIPAVLFVVGGLLARATVLLEIRWWKPLMFAHVR